MKAIFAVATMASLLGAAACGPRQVDVTTGTAPQSQTSVTVTNNSAQQVNVYVETAGTELFVGQVDANNTRTLTVSGVADGTTVTLRARPVGSATGWSRPNVTLSGNVTWTVP
ncbi:MAG: hypothetical protein M3373_09305 [Gemmatimonadota bacterium]|nr:hypothetical protein [Gemmatimonadota bacterium]